MIVLGWIVRAKGLCFKCLNGNHFAPYCKSSCKCLVAGCKEIFHHTLLYKNTDSEVTCHVDACSSVQLNKSKGMFSMSLSMSSRCVFAAKIKKLKHTHF